VVLLKQKSILAQTCFWSLKYMKITLICAPLRFYTPNDEELFFAWINNKEWFE